MDEIVTVKIDRHTAGALYEALTNPKKDWQENTVYIVSITLAREVRDSLFPALEVK